jgi:hypothetical protein
MATAYKEVTTTGPIEWAKVFENNREMVGYEGVYEPCDGAYTVTQVLDKSEFDKLKKAGSQKKPIQKRLLEGDGKIAVKFERKHLVQKSDGTPILKAGGPPKVVNNEGKPWDVEVDGLIGNGTVAEVTNLITTFKGQDGKPISRTSLTKVKIVEFLPYTRPNQEEAA